MDRFPEQLVSLIRPFVDEIQGQLDGLRQSHTELLEEQAAIKEAHSELATSVEAIQAALGKYSRQVGELRDTVVAMDEHSDRLETAIEQHAKNHNALCGVVATLRTKYEWVPPLSLRSRKTLTH